MKEHPAALPFEAVHCFVPGELKITGPDVNQAALTKYVTTAFERAEKCGVKTIVFGSGGARQIPDGFDRTKAHHQLVWFCKMLAPIAHKHGVTVVVEPLNRAECNVLNSVGECASLVRQTDNPGLRLLVDAYHLLRDKDMVDDVLKNGDVFAHVHIATEAKRLAPNSEPCDFAPFFDALVKGGYDGRVSIEAKLPDTVEALAASLALMKSLAADAQSKCGCKKCCK